MNNPKSQISVLSSPTSQLSEPPDIKKWFSSYTYQSPELDTNEELLFCVGINEEKEELCAKKSENERDEKYEDLTRVNHSLSHESNKKVRRHDLPSADLEISGSSSSPTSQLSEPLDIKKWFSSYTYQSPELDTNEDLLFCVGINDEKKGLCAEKIENEREEKSEDLTKSKPSLSHESNKKVRKYDLSSADVEIPVYPDSLSLPSEPPDITNWFSSYVYNSPELDSAEFDVSLLSGYTSREDKELPVTKVSDGCTKEPTRSSRVENKNNPSAAQDDGSERGNLSRRDNLLPDTIDQRTSGGELNICNTFPDQSVVCPKFEVEELLPIVQDESVDLIGSPANGRAPYNKHRGITETSEETVEKKVTVAEDDSVACWITLNRKPRDENSRSIKKEQEKHTSVENQFISTKKKSRPRISKENPPVKSVHPDEQKGGMLRREVLKERTNFEFSSVPEVAGKWRCPQKNKPNTGPPLKQLRLEKWVHKI